MPKLNAMPEPVSDQTSRLQDWMIVLREELVSLLTDQDAYWTTQKVIQSNARLIGMRSPFFDLFNDSYVYSTIMGLRRLTERSAQVLSLLNVLDEIKAHPDLAPDADLIKLEQDVLELERVSRSVRNYADKYVAHHDRSRKPTELTFGDLKSWVGILEQMFRRYYAIIMLSDVDLVIHYLEDPMRIFTFAWL